MSIYQKPSFKEKQKTLFIRQKKLRENATKSEIDFMNRLKEIGVKFIFQKAFIANDYYCIVDFYLPKPFKIVFEIDGEYHLTDDQKSRDNRKDQYLRKRGFNIIRINNKDVSSFDLSFINH